MCKRVRATVYVCLCVMCACGVPFSYPRSFPEDPQQTEDAQPDQHLFHAHTQTHTHMLKYMHTLALAHTHPVLLRSMMEGKVARR